MKVRLLLSALIYMFKEGDYVEFDKSTGWEKYHHVKGKITDSTNNGRVIVIENFEQHGPFNGDYFLLVSKQQNHPLTTIFK